uniref:Uncharacterized protein n=1 Tax=Arundo donax TaxID=35708 RepID=A0A0A9GSN8_ARUDO
MAKMRRALRPGKHNTRNEESKGSSKLDWIGSQAEEAAPPWPLSLSTSETAARKEGGAARTAPEREEVKQTSVCLSSCSCVSVPGVRDRLTCFAATPVQISDGVGSA